MFTRQNELTFGLHGMSLTLLNVKDKMNAVITKLRLFVSLLEKLNFSQFKKFKCFLSENEFVFYKKK
jgi:hypothetical protein